MNAIQELRREHEAIAGILERFERCLDEAERELEIERETIERVLDFFERVVDGQHQEKEERVFLPALLERVQGQDSRLARELFRAHSEDRKLLGVMRDHVDSAAYGEPTSRAVVVRYGRLYVLHERKHAAWEERVVFALAERHLSSADEAEIARGFASIDALWESTVVAEARRLAAWLDLRGAHAGA